MPDPAKTGGNPVHKQVADAVFEYLRKILYDPEHADLDDSVIPDDFDDVIAGLRFLAACAAENKQFSERLMNGELDCEPPSVENALAAPMKAMQGTLNHLAWQVSEVAKGDYSQRVDFMGDLGDAVNAMTRQLAERETELKKERDSLEQANREMASMHDLMMQLALGSTRFIIFYDLTNHMKVFETDTVQRFAQEHPRTSEEVETTLANHRSSTDDAIESWEIELCPPPGDGMADKVRFSVSSRSVSWHGRTVIAHVLLDDTENMKAEQMMEDLAFRDPLTKLYNRRYGMKTANHLISEGKPFILAFIDLDNLKYCNDNFGHAEGDIYINQLANALHSIPGHHTLCRIGGDEFMIVTDEMDADTIGQILRQLREDLIASPVPEGYLYHRSFSYGIIEVEANTAKDLEEYLSEADTRMYEFKYAHKKGLKISD